MSVDDDRNQNEEEYDEEADSDFVADGANEEDLSSSSDDDGAANNEASRMQRKRPKINPPVTTNETTLELDSGDEATIKEQKRAKRKLKKKGESVDGDSDIEGSGWRAKTRAMRERDKDVKKLSKLVNLKESTINVDRLWDEMNRPGPLPPVRTEGPEALQNPPLKDTGLDIEQNKENIPALVGEEMITIKRKFKFAGEVHVEEKIVPKSSAEARLWLTQQETNSQPVDEGSIVAQRPLRKISRFDPNYNNLAAFKMTWSRTSGNDEPFKGPKLNVVEKSKMDWASHVDAEGLKDELDEHSKAKDGYHGRMDFLGQVEQRKEEEARLARTKR